MSRYRWSVFSRIMAGGLGGYGLTSLICTLISLLLQRWGVGMNEAILAPTMASFLIYAAIMMSVFHARSATRAWFWLVGMALPLVLLALSLKMAVPHGTLD